MFAPTMLLQSMRAPLRENPVTGKEQVDSGAELVLYVVWAADSPAHAGSFELPFSNRQPTNQPVRATGGDIVSFPVGD